MMPNPGDDGIGATATEEGHRGALGAAVRVILRNAAASWAGYLINIAIAFFLTPFVLRSLGDVRYGIWAIVMSLTGYYGLLDLGFRFGLTQYLARYLAVKDFKALNQTASTGLLVLGSCGLLVVLGSLGLAAAFPHWWKLSPDNRYEAQCAIVLVGAGFAVQLTFFVYSSVFNATQRQDLANAIALATRVFTAVATVLVLRAGYGLPALALVIALGNVFEYLLRIPVAYKILPELRIRLSNASLKHARAFSAFGAASVLIQIGNRLIFYSDALVIGAAMPTAALAPFTLASGLVTYFADLFTPIGWVLSPAFAAMNAKGETGNLRVLYVESTRVMALAVGVIGVVLAFAANPFFRLWVGPGYLEQNAFGSASLIFVTLLVAAAANATQRAGHQVFLGFMQPWQLARFVAGEAAVNLCLSIALVRPMGLMGVALGTMVPALFFNCLIVPRAACRMAGTPFAAYLRRVFCRPLFAALLTVVAGLAFQRAVPDAGWGVLLARGALIGVVGVIAAVAVGMTSEDRLRLVWGPLGRLRSRPG